MARQHVTTGAKWGRLGCLGLVFIVAIGVLVLNEFVGNAGGDVPIDGMACGAEMGGYHLHVHLDLVDAGRPVFLYPRIGWSQQGSCWYWLHTHDGSGVIHVEGPDASFGPTLGKFFDVWHQPLSRRQFLDYRVKRRQSMRVFVNLRPYTGNPRAIPLRRHTTITIEIGPPFKAPAPYRFPPGY